MENNTTMTRAWQGLWSLRKRHDAPLPHRLLAAGAVALAAGLLLMTVSGVLTGRESDPGWWRASFLFNMVTSVCIAAGMLAVCRVAEWGLPEAWLARLSAPQDARAMAALNLLLALGITLGAFTGLFAAAAFYGFDAARAIGHPLAQARFYMLLAVLSLAAWFWWLVRMRQLARQRALQHEASEAQLRLLQGQIEPHFLFNTLANVESLMDADPPRARRMLEAFTDYLRAGLVQLRHADSTLEAELAMGQRYLELMQIRMGERLSFRIEADAEARAAALPTLLLQPLIENAIQHGVEPKVAGGCVRVLARVSAGRLALRVEDDGLGSEAPRHAHRRGNGMALANIRSRLQTRYGGTAALALELQQSGACALLELPYTAQP
ncbi:histidine kinase [Massilia sp. Root418]|uniref:sensor histidine kinase n=1 Tax=Massilia sp. Root418 TaxID=1736532 RepID=UPI0006FFE25C|nr:histidine kinase [Massilia sp. Root418]KQW88452.1 histidine kinase [Massilia sp. Root418]